jgi:hypothetical protein
MLPYSTLSSLQKEGRPLSWAPSADAVAGGGWKEALELVIRATETHMHQGV